jgi:hypothetical protein
LTSSGVPARSADKNWYAVTKCVRICQAVDKQCRPTDGLVAGLTVGVALLGAAKTVAAAGEVLEHELQRARRRVLAAELAGKLGRRRWHVHDTREPAEFVGYQVTRGGLVPAAKVWARLPGKLRLAARRGPSALARTVASYRAIVSFG